MSAPDQVLIRRRRPAPRTVLAIASLGAAVAFIDATIVNIAFPDIHQSFPDTSISSLSWVLNAYNIVFAAFLVAAGRIADLVGRRRMFILGLELFTFASLLCALAPSASALIGFRVVQALGAACLVPSSLALVLSAFPPEHRSHGVALLSAVGAAAAGLGPSLGGLLVAADDWRLVFLVNLPVGVAAVVLARRRLVESRAPGRRRLPDLTGTFLFGISIAALVLGVVKGQEWGWTSARVIGSFAVAAIAGAWFLSRSRWHRSPIIDLSLLRIRTFSAANGMTVIGAAGFYGYTLTNVLFLTGVWGYSVLKAGLALTIGPAVAVVFAGPTSRLALRVGHRPVLVAGGLIWGGAVMWFVLRAGATPDFLGVWLPGMVLLGIGAGTLFPNLSGAAVASAPGHSFATATGINSVARQVGAALGVAVVVAILGTPSPLDAVTVFHHAWAFGAGCLFAAGLGCLMVGRVRPEKAPSLTDAARAVLREPPPHPADTLPPRAHRAIIVAPEASAPLRQSTADFLATVPLFAQLEPELREALAARTRSVTMSAGEWLFHEGDPGDALYVVRAGRLEVVDEPTGRMIRELGRGDAVGELALVTEAPRSASVRAARSCELLAMSSNDFAALLSESPALSLQLNRVLASQLREARASAPTTRPRPVTVALVSLEPRVSLAEIAGKLARSLRREVSACLLDRPASADADPTAVFAPLLDRAEAEHELVLLSAALPAQDNAEPWSSFCLQQADRILAVTGGGPAPASIKGWPELRGCDLVAYDVDPGAGKLSALAEALDPVESHVLRARELDADIDRIARRLTGRSVGIVLSGGGARAFAHLGVLQELTADGITIDRVSGVSMGAVIGALFAMGLPPDEIDEICFEEWVRRRPLSDYTLPRHALIRGDRFRAMLHRTFGTHAIEELPLSFMCGYTELRSGNLVVARHGPLWEQVGYSICLPVIAPPQVRGRDIYVDGSLVDNLPVAAMAELAEGPIIAVDVKASLEKPAGDSSADGRPNGRERPPPLGETLARVLLLGSSDTSASARRYASLVIQPRPEGIGLLEFHQLDAAREAGRQAARAAIENATTGVFA